MRERVDCRGDGEELKLLWVRTVKGTASWEGRNLVFLLYKVFEPDSGSEECRN